jgi:hypothetical protein
LKINIFNHNLLRTLTLFTYQLESGDSELGCSCFISRWPKFSLVPSLLSVTCRIVDTLSVLHGLFQSYIQAWTPTTILHASVYAAQIKYLTFHTASDKSSNNYIALYINRCQSVWVCPKPSILEHLTFLSRSSTSSVLELQLRWLSSSLKA